MHLAVLMTAIIFCSALPILNIGALLYFAAAYLGDKAELLRLCRMPPIYSTRVLLVAMGGLRWAVVGHLVFAAWAFSIHRTGAADLGDLRGVLSAAYAILPGSLLTPNISSGHFEDRLLQTSAVPYTLVALLVPVVLLARAAVTVSSALLSDIGGCALPSLELGGSNSRVRPSDHPPLSDQQVRAELAGPDTYQNMRTEVVGGSAARRFLLHCLLAADEGQQLGPLHMMCDGAVDPERLGGLLRQPGQMLPRNGSESARLPGKVREMLGNPGGGSSAAVHGNTRAGGPGTKDPLGFTDEDPEAEQKAMLLRNQIGL